MRTELFNKDGVLETVLELPDSPKEIRTAHGRYKLDKKEGLTQTYKWDSKDLGASEPPEKIHTTETTAANALKTPTKPPGIVPVHSPYVGPHTTLPSPPAPSPVTTTETPEQKKKREHEEQIAKMTPSKKELLT